MDESKKGQSFKKKRRVRYVHTDSLGVTFFANYLVFFDDALTDYFRKRGVISTPEGELILNGKKYADKCWAISEVSCKYYVPSTYDDILEISAAVKELGDKKVVFNFRCYNKTTLILSAEGRMSMVYFDKKAKHSVEIPAEIKRLLS